MEYYALENLSGEQLAMLEITRASNVPYLW